MPSKPLSDVMVLDVSRLIPGPFCSRLLRDYGAKVVKVEDPKIPDSLKNLSPSLYRTLNRGKKIVFCPYSNPEGRKKMAGLLREADALVESFRPGALASMGWPVKEIHRINPRLIIASISGYGQKGKNKMKAGHDANYLAMSGILSALHPHPQLSGVQWADLVGGGLFGALAIVSQVLARGKKGKGVQLDVSMTGNMSYLRSGAASTPILAGALARYKIYETADNRYMALAALEDKFWNRFCDCVGFSAFKSNGDYPDQSLKAHRQLEELFKSKSFDEWSRIGEENDICLTPLL